MQKSIALYGLLLADLMANEYIEDYIAANQGRMTILFFYTSWCTACKDSIDLLNEVHLKYGDKVRVIGVELDDGVKRKRVVEPSDLKFRVIKQTLPQANGCGVKESVPVILLINGRQSVIKRFYETPSRQYFVKLVGRLSRGYLKNGTLPAESAGRPELFSRFELL